MSSAFLVATIYLESEEGFLFPKIAFDDIKASPQALKRLSVLMDGVADLCNQANADLQRDADPT